MPFYVVGESTASALRATFMTYEQLGLEPPEIRGQGSGNAAVLGPFILNDMKERPAKLLYLTGDKNRDTLPNILEEGGLSLLSLQVYMTQGSSTFEATLDSRLMGADNGVFAFSGKLSIVADTIQMTGGLSTLPHRLRTLQHPFFKRSFVKMRRREQFRGSIGMVR